MSLHRRSMLLGAAGLAAPFVARGQGLRKVRFTMPWLAQGSTLYSQVALQKGFWRKRGLDVDVARGFGSVAVAQAIGSGQFDFGVVQSPWVVLSASKQLPITCLAFISYSAAWGVALRDDSPIRTPADLAGKRIGGTPASGDFPLLPVFLKRAGIDPASVELVALDSKLAEQVLINRQVDGISCVVSSTAPVMLSQKAPSRYLMYKDYGVDSYGLALAAYRPHLQNDPDLCRAFTDGLMEGVAYALTNPAESLEIFYDQIPEIGLTESGHFFTEAGLAMFGLLINDEASRRDGLGAADPARVEAMIDLVMGNLAAPGAARPAMADVFNASYAGQVTLTPPQWDAVAKLAAPYQSYFHTRPA